MKNPKSYISRRKNILCDWNNRNNGERKST